MIVDLHLNGKKVLIVGGGREAVRKVEALLSQDCEIIVVGEQISEEIESWAENGKLTLDKTKVVDGGFIKNCEGLGLVMAVTDDPDLNRKIVEAGRKLGCWTYAADDPEVSDFSHPAVINLYDTVQVAVSTGGKSPLMAKKIRERAEQVFKEIIQKEDILQIRLQETLRKEAKQVLSGPDERKRFLNEIAEDGNIRELLARDQLQEAEAEALKRLQNLSGNR